ncbi:MAG: DUF948 domain-containing protein [Sporichthyaceae bacterium]|nr:DUF948 domain-containing protein [Sporichthyaceae bacterium]
MEAWDVAGIIIAVFWAILVCFLAYMLVHLTKVLKETTVLVSNVTEHTVPLLTELVDTVAHTNAQLGKVDTITTNLAGVSTNVNALTSTFTHTIGGPLVKIASFAYGLRTAAKLRHRADAEKKVRETMKAGRAARRSAR